VGSLHAELTIAAHRDPPQFAEAASYSRSSENARCLSIVLARPASAVGKTRLIHVSKSDIPLDRPSQTLKQRFPCAWRFDCAIADVSLSCANLAVLTLRQALLLSRVERG
jgi:hypothetical protein